MFIGCCMGRAFNNTDLVFQESLISNAANREAIAYRAVAEHFWKHAEKESMK